MTPSIKPTHNPNPGFPLHRFNRAQTLAWLKFPNLRPFTASELSKRYPSGCGILAATLRLFVIVEPGGKFRDVPPPHKQFEMWQVANAPNPVLECACRDYYYPEAEGPWSLLEGRHGHHPHCQFRDTAIHGFKVDAFNAENRIISALGTDWEHKFGRSGINPQARPDEWLRTAEEIKKS